jgi:endonuclease/exonuclease/phosphatase family metal-dependent hydrolase
VIEAVVKKRTERLRPRARRPFLEDGDSPAALPYLSLVRSPESPMAEAGPNGRFRVATYNVHRWVGRTGGRWNPRLARDVLDELDADVVALQEVLRPVDGRRRDPLPAIVEECGYHLAFVCSRRHRHGELGNAILSRWPFKGVLTLDLNFSRFERRSAIAAELECAAGMVAMVATHLALVDRTRTKQVHAILGHPQLQGPVVLFGDMNAWRSCRATRQLDRVLDERHHNRAWPATFPATSPLLALDRIYARGVRVIDVRTHQSAAARRGSDHLPVVASIEVEG